jgi:L-glyceraldehyde 3-phosphate reductase
VRSGKALYVGISSYQAAETRRAAEILGELGTPCLIHQPSYSIFNRWVEDELLQTIRELKKGCIVFSPLAQGLLTDRYLGAIPLDSRAAKSHGFLQRTDVTPERVAQIRALAELAAERGQTLAQLAIAWVLRDEVVTSALIGASRVSQIEDCVKATENTDFSAEELTRIDTIVT